jgi:hypothetical protein
MNAPKNPQRLVPTLTEVIDVPAARAPRWGADAPAGGGVAAPVRPQPAWTPPVVAPAAAASKPAAAEVGEAPPVAETTEWPSEDELVRRVVEGLKVQLDTLFDGQMQEVMAPALARAADGLIRELRGELDAGLRGLVERAVASEVARLHRR